MSNGTRSPSSGAKSMSSRLLTMKFMQRAAASSTSSPSSTPEGPSTKRQKTTAFSPSKVNVDALADRLAIRAALAEEESKRQIAVERQAVEAGDTRWVLIFEDQKDSATLPATPYRIEQTGYANLGLPSPPNLRYADDGDVMEDKSASVGRRSFGKFNPILEKQLNPSSDYSSESDSGCSGDEVSAPEAEDSNTEVMTGTNLPTKASGNEVAGRKAEREANKRAKKSQSGDLAKRRKQKNVKLNGLTSLTGRQDIVKACFKCGGPHLQAACPQNKRGYEGAEDGPPQKSRKPR